MIKNMKNRCPRLQFPRKMSFLPAAALLERSRPSPVRGRNMGFRHQPLLPPYSAGRWRGTLCGHLEEIAIAWTLVFDLCPAGDQFQGQGYLRGSATQDTSLIFTISGDRISGLDHGDADLMIAVQDPLPENDKLYMSFDLKFLRSSAPDHLAGRFHLHCCQPLSCGCAGGHGTFRAQKDSELR